MERGGSLRQLMLSAESNSLQVACIFQSYSTDNRLHWTSASHESANIADLLVELDCLDATIKHLKGVRNESGQQRFAELYGIGRMKLIEESEKLISKYDYPLPPDELLFLCRTDTPTPTATDAIEGERTHIMFLTNGRDSSHCSVRSGCVSTDLRLVYRAWLSARLDWYLFEEERDNDSEFSSVVSLSDDCWGSLRSIDLKITPTLTAHQRPSTLYQYSQCWSLLAGSSIPFRSWGTAWKASYKTRVSYWSVYPYAYKRSSLPLPSGLGRRLRRSSIIGGAESSSRSSQFLSPHEHDDQRFSSVGHLNMPSSSNDNIETNHYKFQLDALLALLNHELDLLFYAFADEFKSSIFIKLIAIPLVYMEHEAQKLCETVRQLPNKINTGKSYLHGLLSILNWFLRSKTKFTKLHHVTLPTRGHWSRHVQLLWFRKANCPVTIHLSLLYQRSSNNRSVTLSLTLFPKQMSRWWSVFVWSWKTFTTIHQRQHLAVPFIRWLPILSVSSVILLTTTMSSLTSVWWILAWKHVSTACSKKQMHQSLSTIAVFRDEKCWFKIKWTVPVWFERLFRWEQRCLKHDLINDHWFAANLMRFLVENLQKKAEMYIRSDDQSIGRVFLLNNTKYLLDRME